MADEQQGYTEQINPNIKIKDLEEKQRTLRDQLRLIGKNLIEIR